MRHFADAWTDDTYDEIENLPQFGLHSADGLMTKWDEVNLAVYNSDPDAWVSDIEAIADFPECQATSWGFAPW